MDRTDRSTEVETLYRQHGAALLLFASAISGDRGGAQDAVHHVFLKAIENGSLGRAVNKKSYLFACVRNAVLNDARLQGRSVPLDVDSAWFSAPDRDYAGEQNLRRALGGLPADQREVIVLHVWGEPKLEQVLGTVPQPLRDVIPDPKEVLGQKQELDQKLIETRSQLQ